MAQEEKKSTNEVPGYVKVADVAKTLDMTPQWVRDLTKKGVLKTRRTAAGDRYFLPEAIRDYIAYLREQANSKKKPEDTVKAEADKLRAEADLKQSKAKIADLQLQELEGQMHRSEDVEAVTTDLVFTIRGMMLALPGRLAIDLATIDKPAEISERIKQEVHAILLELSNYTYDADVYKKRVRDREGWSEISDGQDDE